MISGALRQAIDAGCADLVECAQAGCRPIPFTPIADLRRSTEIPEDGS
ncbi:hypothetical protein [Actinocorallia herbida]|nr:hypothetical protein [Actinocorallia herbida]